MMAVLIRYQPDIRINGQPHGPVYAVDLGDLHPGVHMRTAFTGTPDPAAATPFTRAEAETLVACHPWREAVIVEADDAPLL